MIERVECREKSGLSSRGFGQECHVVGIGLGVRPDAHSPKSVVQYPSAMCREPGDPNAAAEDAELQRCATRNHAGHATCIR